MKKTLASLFTVCTVLLSAQNYTHSLSISSKQNGLQALSVTPDLKNISNTGFNDVRIYDKNNNEVPYFLVNESFSYSSTKFKEFVVSDKSVDHKHNTTFVVSNPDKKPIQNIVLRIANSDAYKSCDIEGSDDKQQWYAVSDHIFMYNLYDEGTVDAFRTLSFPMVNYKFIKIHIYDWHTAPLNVLKAGYFEGAINAGKLNEIKPSSYTFSTNKEQKVSTSSFEFSNPVSVDKIMFKVKSPNFYKRHAAIYAPRQRTVKQNIEVYRELLMEFELNSESNNSFELHNFREKQFFIEIDNQDNPPLEFETIDLKQLQSYLVADFKAGENYVLKAGDKKLKVPSYDLEYFRDKISQYLPTLEVSELKVIPQAPAAMIVQPEKKLWEEPWFMWVCIALVSFVLFLFSVRVLKDLKKK